MYKHEKYEVIWENDKSGKKTLLRKYHLKKMIRVEKNVILKMSSSYTGAKHEFTSRKMMRLTHE